MYRVDRKTWAPRQISIYCNAQSHAPEAPELTVLTSSLTALFERWWPDKRAEQHRLTTERYANARPESVALLGMVTRRFKVTCHLCGLSVTVGDRLGTGFAQVAEWSAQVAELGIAAAPMNLDLDERSRAAHIRLSRVADTDTCGLSLTTFDRVLNMR